MNLLVEINNLLPSNVVAILCQLSNLFPVIDNKSVFEHEHPFSYQTKFALSTLSDLLEFREFENFFFEINNFLNFLFLNALIEKTSKRYHATHLSAMMVIHAASKINHAALFSHVLSDSSSVFITVFIVV